MGSTTHVWTNRGQEENSPTPAPSQAEWSVAKWGRSQPVSPGTRWRCWLAAASLSSASWLGLALASVNFPLGVDWFRLGSRTRVGSTTHVWTNHGQEEDSPTPAPSQANWRERGADRVTSQTWVVDPTLVLLPSLNKSTPRGKFTDASAKPSQLAELSEAAANQHRQRVPGDTGWLRPHLATFHSAWLGAGVGEFSSWPWLVQTWVVDTTLVLLPLQVVSSPPCFPWIVDRRVSDAYAADRRICKEIEYIFVSYEKKKYSISMFILLSAAYVSLARRSVDRL